MHNESSTLKSFIQKLGVGEAANPGFSDIRGLLARKNSLGGL